MTQEEYSKRLAKENEVKKMIKGLSDEDLEAVELIVRFKHGISKHQRVFRYPHRESD